MNPYGENPGKPKRTWTPLVLATQILAWVVNGGLGLLWLFALAATDCSGTSGRPYVCDAHVGTRIGAGGGVMAGSLALAVLAIRLPVRPQPWRALALVASLVLSVIALLIFWLHSLP